MALVGSLVLLALHLMHVSSSHSAQSQSLSLRVSECPLPAGANGTTGTSVPHPFMNFLFSEVKNKRNSRWRRMNERGGATIRGITPTAFEWSNGPNPGLSFITETGFDLNTIQHADLVLRTLPLSNATSASFDRTSSRFPLEKWRRESDSLTRISFLILDLTSRLKRWNRTGPFCVRAPKLEPERPLLVLYHQEAVGAEAEVEIERADRSERSVRSGSVRSKGRRVPAACRLRPFDASLPDMKWSLQVLAPSDVRMNFCAGLCEISEARHNHRMYVTNNSLIRGLIHVVSRVDDLPKPCCVPTRFAPETFMLFKNGEIVIEVIRDIVATQCGCA